MNEQDERRKSIKHALCTGDRNYDMYPMPAMPGPVAVTLRKKGRVRK